MPSAVVAERLGRTGAEGAQTRTGAPTPSAPKSGRFARLFSGLRMHHLLFIAFTFVAAVPVAILDFWESHATFENEMDSVRERHLLVARNLTLTLSRYVIDVKAAFEVTLASGALTQSVAGLTDLLVSLDFNHICIIKSDGSVESALPGLPSSNALSLDAPLLADLRQLATKGPGPTLSTLRHDASDKAVFYMVKTLPGDRLGLAVISTNYLIKLQKTIAFGERGHAVITDAVGRVVAHPIPEWTAKSPDISRLPIVQAQIRGQTGVMGFYSPAFNDDMIAGYSSVPESGWGVMVPQPVGELKRRARQIDSLASIIAIAALAGAALLSWGIAGFLSRPIRSVAGTADSILAGDETAKAPAFRGLVPREIRRLGIAFNTMVDGLQRRNAETRRALQQAELSNRAKTQFLANMSHEIRTPLNGVLGMVELLRQTPLDAKQLRYADTATRSGASLLGIINDVLDLSKIEAGRLELEIAPLALARLVEETADLYAEQARAKGLSMNVSVSDDLRQTVMGDAYRLGQILNNLIGNAVKFTNVGGLYIRAESLDQSADSLLARFEIKDTGIGIAEATLPVIFDDFVQANGSTTREYGGTGLGLSISRRLCSLMGGEIAVQSRPGVGSVFSFTVRFRKTSAAAQQVRTMPAQTVSPVGVHPAPEGAPSAPVGGAHILLAEDNLLNMELAQAMLHSLGCSVVGAPDGEAAVAAYAAERFDMVLMDLQMPKMDGLAATGAIRDYERTHGIRTPVLALTAHALPGDRDRSLAAGLDDHLTKPVSFAVLEEAIRNWVRKPAGTVAAPQATMPAIDANQVIDAVAIERLREVERAGNAGLLRRVLQQFLDGGDAMIRQMEAAITSGDAASIRQATHTLKSNSAYLGAERLRLRCLDLEQAVETGATTQLPGLLDQIKTEYTHASESLAKLLQETAVA